MAAHDVGRAVNPVSVEGQIEGGVVMSLGYALTEDFPLEHGTAHRQVTPPWGSSGPTETPDVEAIIVEKHATPSWPAAPRASARSLRSPPRPAVQLAYYNFDGKFRTRLPLEDTPYSRKK